MNSLPREKGKVVAKRIAIVLSVVFLIGLVFSVPPLHSQGKDYTHLVILSDLHLPGRLIPLKEKAVDTINSWADVDTVVLLGDICNDLGTVQEYAYARNFLSRLKKPLEPIVGNHDYIYDDSRSVAGKRVKGSYAVRKSKLQRFKDIFSLAELQRSKRSDPYRLIFLSIDDLNSKLLAEISEETLQWLRAELGRNRNTPTIIFYHAPLRGTLMSGNKDAEDENFIAQPAGKIHNLLKENPQVFLWVSGHTHIGATHEKFHHPVNLYDQRVTNIHNCDLDGRSYLADADFTGRPHENIWTNSLYLYSDKVVVKTYDHRKNGWLKELEREVFPKPWN